MSRYNILKEAVAKALKECKNPAVDGLIVEGGGFDKFKYKLAKNLTGYFREFPWIETAWYADISGGEFLVGKEYYGRDLDILIKGDEPEGFNAESLERELEEQITEAMVEYGRDLKSEIGLSNIIELHINDFFVRMAGSPQSNAIKIYSRD